MNSIKRNFVIMVAVFALVLGMTTIGVTAKTLKEAFSGGTKISTVDHHLIKGCKYKKTCWAQTKGYKGKHYVRAYIGGSSSSPRGASADSGRKWATGDNKASCNVKLWDYGEGLLALFPTGYAKYGK